MSTHSSILAWRIPLGSYSPQGDKVGHDSNKNTHTQMEAERNKHQPDPQITILSEVAS